MQPFATEFPVKQLSNRAAFVAEVVAWLYGTKYSSVLSSGAEANLDSENAHLRSASGEELRLRELSTQGIWDAIGFRHDFPDGEGRLWRTEAVLRRASADADQDLVRVRTQCIATIQGAHLERPKKPYFIKTILQNAWGGLDGEFGVSDQPIWLEDSADGLETARKVIMGSSTTYLPVVYISATGRGTWLLDERDIEKLAYDLGGIAHVVVEPDRPFSFRLRDQTEGKNAYGGTVCLALPKRGLVSRYYLGWQLQTGKDLALAVKSATIGLCSQMPSKGWDWTELQEQALRTQRERDRKRLSSAESEQLYLEEIENLRDENLQLKDRIRNNPVESVAGIGDADLLLENLVLSVGPEVYVGEISDRLRFAAQMILSGADRMGLDPRSRTIFKRILERIPQSPGLRELRHDLGRASKDPKRVGVELTALLCRHGYSEKSANKHIRLESTLGDDGLESITLSKTPSESRGLDNLRKQIERTLGLTKL